MSPLRIVLLCVQVVVVLSYAIDIVRMRRRQKKVRAYYSMVQAYSLYIHIITGEDIFDKILHNIRDEGVNPLLAFSPSRWKESNIYRDVALAKQVMSVTKAEMIFEGGKHLDGEVYQTYVEIMNQLSH